MRGFSTGRYIGQEELELWTLPGWFPALGKPGFPQIPQLRRLGCNKRDLRNRPPPDSDAGKNARATSENHRWICARWGRRNRKLPTDSAEEAKLIDPRTQDVTPWF